MKIDGKTQLAGVVGWPVAHSRSPLIHNFWLSRHGINGAYVPLAVAPEDFREAIMGLRAASFRGVNVTVPHKEAAAKLADIQDDTALRTGAVNTLIFRNGKIEGMNTDCFGFSENLREQAPHWVPAGGPVLVLGAGGAARAVIWALLQAGVGKIRVANRSLTRAQDLALQFGPAVHAHPWEEVFFALEDVSLLVNTTTLGMEGQAPLELSLDRLPATAVVADIVYTPLETPLLAAARARGNRTVDGLGMLLHQARPGFAAWFGENPVIDDELRRHVLAPQ